MSKPFDATTKSLMAMEPAAWLRLAGLLAPDETPPEITVLDTDLSTISAAVDKIFRRETDEPSLDHFELQSSYEAGLDERIHWYNALIRREYGLPVRSIAILLRPQADGSHVRGRVYFEEDTFYLDFRYRVVRLWQVPPDMLLQGGLSTLPLAPLTVNSEKEAERIIREMRRRIDSETEGNQNRELWMATYVLMGLSYRQSVVDRLLKGVLQMKDSVTYQAILQEGRAEGRAEGISAGKREGEMSLIRRLGERHLGTMPESVLEKMGKMTIEELEKAADRLLEVKTWQELIVSEG